jgi:hypothetical protein
VMLSISLCTIQKADMLKLPQIKVPTDFSQLALHIQNLWKSI